MTLKNYMNMIYKNCELKNYVYRWSRSSSDLYPSLAIAWFSREYKGEETSLEKRKGETAKGDPFYLLAVPLPPPPPSPSPSLLCQVRAKVYVCLLFVYKGLHSLYPAAQPFSGKRGLHVWVRAPLNIPVHQKRCIWRPQVCAALRGRVFAPFRSEKGL